MTTNFKGASNDISKQLNANDYPSEWENTAKTVDTTWNMLLEYLIKIAESHESKSVHIDTLKQMKR